MRPITQSVLGLILAALLTMAVPATADAKVPIPCTGDRVIEYPNRMPPAPNGEAVRLGYLIQNCIYGKWIGLTGKSGRYFSMNASGVETLTQGGVLPSPPNHFVALMTRPRTFWAEWAWIITILIISIAVWISNRREAQPGR